MSPKMKKTKIDPQTSSLCGKGKKRQQARANSSAYKGKNKRPTGSNIFESYINLKELSDGLKRGEFIQGQLRINPKKYKDAFIPSPDGARDILLDGIVARNRALNGDIVAVQILPRDQWKVMKTDTKGKGATGSDTQKESVMKTAQKKTDRMTRPGDVVEDLDELARKMRNTNFMNKGEHLADSSILLPNLEIRQKTAKVVYIVEKKHSRAVTGFLKFLPHKPFALFVPVDLRVPRINVLLADCPQDFCSRQADYTYTLFICRITNWAANRNFAEGQLAKTLGQAGDIEPETEGILQEYEVDVSEFSEEVMKCLPKDLPWSIPTEEINKRKDLRKECIFTIDPASAKDLDDALSCRVLPDGNFEVGVHVADVSYFVGENTALDAIASQRTTTVYMVQKVIPMLPRLLCEELCSLNPLTDRLTFSVIWQITPKGTILSEWFGRSVIRSCATLTYDHGQSMIDAPGKTFAPEELTLADPPEHPVDVMHRAVLDLHSIAQNLRAQRFSEGALRLDQSKLSFTLDKETMMPQGCYVYQYKDSNKLVEEFMLLANTATAKHIHASFPELALLRRHPPPKAKMVEELQELCDQLEINIDLSSAGALHESLNAAVGHDEYFSARKEVLAHMCSKPMQLAAYFCAGLPGEESFKHYSLNVPLYTHFTSPIRRYADLVVHRLLAASLNCGPSFGMSMKDVKKQASHCNDKSTVSKRVQELSAELFFGAFVKNCGPLDAEGMVMRVLDQSFDVLVLPYRVQKRIYCKHVAGLQSFRHRQVRAKHELTLVWLAEDPEKAPLQQLISIFSLVELQLKADAAPTKYSAVLKRPEEKQPRTETC